MRTALMWLGLACLPAALLAMPGRPGAGGSQRLERGVLLVANRTLNDPNFSRSVVLVTHLGDTGTTGLVLNRPLPVPATDALPPLAPLATESGPLFLGGPVAVGALQLLVRTPADLGPASRIVADVHVVETADTFQNLVDGRIQTTALRLFAGYAGWAPGQLESELRRGDWILRDADADTIFASEPERLWPELIDGTDERWVRTRHDADVAAEAQYNLMFAPGWDRVASVRGGTSSNRIPSFRVRAANARGPGACGRGQQPTC